MNCGATTITMPSKGALKYNSLGGFSSLEEYWNEIVSIYNAVQMEHLKPCDGVTLMFDIHAVNQIASRRESYFAKKASMLKVVTTPTIQPGTPVVEIPGYDYSANVLIPEVTITGNRETPVILPATEPKFNLKDWFEKNKNLVYVLLALLVLIAFYFMTKKKGGN